MTENFYVDNIYCYFKLLSIYKRQYRKRGLYTRWDKGHNVTKYHDYMKGHFNFNWEMRGQVPDEELQKTKFFQ